MKNVCPKCHMRKRRDCIVYMFEPVVAVLEDPEGHTRFFGRNRLGIHSD